MGIAELTEEQRKVRRTGIGASEIAALAGLDPDKRPIDVYQAKVDATPDDEESEPAEWGRRLEDPVAAKYAHQHNLLHVRRGEGQVQKISWPLLREAGMLVDTAQTFRAMKFPLALATPDRLVYPGKHEGEAPRRLVQIKTTGWWRRDEWTDSEVPDRCMAQVQWELGVCTTDELRNDLVVLIAGQRYREYPITFDPELFLGLYDIAARFWKDHVTKKVPPPLDGTPSSESYLRRAFPRSLGKTVEAREEDEHLVERLREVLGRLDECQEAAELLENRIKARMGIADYMLGNGWKASWKSNQQGNVIWKAVAMDLVDMVRRGEITGRSLNPEDVDRLLYKHRGVPARPFRVTFDNFNGKTK